MQLLADIYRDAYYKADRDEKTRITKTIVMVIKRKGHRFLKFDKSLDEWREVSDETARHKIGHAMRDGRDRPDGPVDPKEVEDVPILSEDVRKSVERMLAFNRKESAQSFGQDEVDILSGLFANSSSTSPAGSEEGGNGSKPPSR